MSLYRQIKTKQMWAAYSTKGKIKIRMGENQPAQIVNEVAYLQALLGPDNRDLREILEACRSTAPCSHDQTAAEATGGRVANASRQAPSRAAGDPRDGPATIKGRQQPPRHAGLPR